MSSDCERFHRRDVLTLGTTAGLMGLSLPDILRSQARASRVPQERTARADSIIMLWLAGGPATIDMWDLKPDAPEEIRGEFKAAETSVPGIRLSEHLSKVGQTAKHLAVVRSMHHTVPAHGPATVFMTTGNKPTPAIEYPSVGSLTSKLLKVPEGVPPYVSFNDIRGQGGAAGYLGAGYNPFIVEGAGGGKNAPATLRVRGIQLPGGFSLGQLNKRDALLGISTTPSARSTRRQNLFPATTPSTRRRSTSCGPTARRKPLIWPPKARQPAKDMEPTHSEPVPLRRAGSWRRVFVASHSAWGVGIPTGVILTA